eukprot:CAMPEP_0170749992 /NCGR_PEP_ID=MMETSP0437-20130122/10689_1 /TAXON_ID=0 /ORGANISM="Sexangularia sp." /LENGTH=109 /DNA_ID=CAMNT_0011088949 /DNA_START=59 /DNA_END=388 /DNA_ORIENTATION=-
MGGGPRFDFPKQVWSPSGGWWAGGLDNPLRWRRNLAIAATALVLSCIPVAMIGFKHEHRSVGYRPVWSQQFSGHLAEDDPEYAQKVQKHRETREPFLTRIWPDKKEEHH